MKRIGLALGGGGAKGFAHLAYLEAMEEMGARPDVVAGTSMGAVMGALYVCGYAPSTVLDTLRALSTRRIPAAGLLFRLQHLPPALAAHSVKRLLAGFLGGKTFEQTAVPFKTVAVDFHTLEQRVFSKGPVMDGVMASIALPGFFPPYACGGAYYIDGGAVDLVPFDILRDECDILVAIDVNTSKGDPVLPPTAQNAYIAAWNAVSDRLLSYQLAAARIDVLERPEFPDVGITQFDRFEEAYDDAQRGIGAFKKKLLRLLEAGE